MPDKLLGQGGGAKGASRITSGAQGLLHQPLGSGRRLQPGPSMTLLSFTQLRDPPVCLDTW